MKTINFINPVPPKKQRFLVIWFYSSLFLIAAFAACAGYLHLFRSHQARQLGKDLGELQQKSNLLDEYLAKKNVLKKNKSLLEEQLNVLRSFHNQVESTHGIFAALATLTPKTICLTAIQGKPNKIIEIEGVALNAQAVTHFLQQLSQNHMLHNLKLVHVLPCLEKSPEGKPLLQFKFEATWKLNQTINLEEQ